jgi:hypothetical protein
MLRVWRDTDGSWRADVGFYAEAPIKVGVPTRVGSLADWPDWLAESITILSCSDIGQTIPDRGKRIGVDHYWVYTQRCLNLDMENRNGSTHKG